MRYSVVGATAFILSACSNQAPFPADDIVGLEPAASNVECSVNGHGTLPNGGLFAGHATLFLNGSAVGHWVHLTGDEVFEGRVDTLTCFINGSSLGILHGSGRWNGEPGYSFDVAATDNAPDEYEIFIYDPASNLVYQSPASAPDNQPDSGNIVIIRS